MKRLGQDWIGLLSILPYATIVAGACVCVGGWVGGVGGGGRGRGRGGVYLGVTEDFCEPAYNCSCTKTMAYETL